MRSLLAIVIPVASVIRPILRDPSSDTPAFPCGTPSLLLQGAKGSDSQLWSKTPLMTCSREHAHAFWLNIWVIMSTPMEISVVSSPASFPTLNLPNGTNGTTQIPETLPSPETFDILPALHELLSRLLSPSEDPSRPPTYPQQEHLSPQQLQAEASIVRNKIRKARETVAALPDIDRSISEQEAEIASLREKIARQQHVLQGLDGG